MEPMFRDVQLSTGVRLRFAQAGAADGPAILMLHGLSDSWFSFSQLLPLLPSGVRGIAPDQRGHGESERPDDGYSMDGMAADALALMDALQLDRAVVVGHSMGSFVARRMAERAPERVAHVVLMASGPGVSSPAVLELAAAIESFADPIDPAFVSDFQWSCVARAVSPAFMERVVAESLKVPARVWKAVLAGTLQCPLPGRLRCPATVVGGELDVPFPAAGQRDLARLVGAESVHMFPGVGHTPQWEVPGELAAILTQVIETAGRGPLVGSRS
jgi:pimeloyl-ACP methyl ester carboxylesterase